ncbi:MAG: glutaredoxin family protein [Deinococcales bacterium]
MILYSKPGCCLCEHAKALLEQAKLEYREVNILEDEAAMRLYAFEIPVLTDKNGKELLKGDFSEARVAALLLRL